MDLPLNLLRPFMGARIIKSGLAVFLALAAFHWIGSTYATFAAVAAILAVQPSVSRTKQLFGQQLLSNLLGGLIGAGLGFYFGDTAWAMALAVVIVLGLCSRFRWNEAANLAVVVVLFVMDRPEHDFLPYTFARIGAVMGGMLIGYLVNRFILPPNFQGRVQEELTAAAEGVSLFGQHVLTSLQEPERYRKEAIKAEVEAIRKRLEGARLFLELYKEAAPPDSAHPLVTEKLHNSLTVALERLTDVHKSALRAGGLAEGAPGGEANRALAAILEYTDRLSHAALAKRAPDLEAGAFCSHSMADLERLVAQRVDDPLTRAYGLSLHEILVSLRHMRDRMDSLATLLQPESVAPSGAMQEG